MSQRLESGTLYVVATPIGHLGDLTRRAEEVLKSVQIVVAEDTRRTRVLLAHIGHRAPELTSLHVHNEADKSSSLVGRLLAGDDVALVADAGTPLVNDPGFLLIQLAQEQGVVTVPVPGCCSITALLSVSPLPGQPFRYVGFLPAKARARRMLLDKYLLQEDALIFLESPKRIQQTLADLAQRSERRIFLGRELTKRHETLYMGGAAEVASQLGPQPKGELIGLVECGEVVASSLSEDQLLRSLLQELPPAQAARLAAAALGRNKSALYARALQLGR